jgi:hypothetical protein
LVVTLLATAVERHSARGLALFHQYAGNICDQPIAEHPTCSATSSSSRSGRGSTFQLSMVTASGPYSRWRRPHQLSRLWSGVAANKDLHRSSQRRHRSIQPVISCQDFGGQRAIDEMDGCDSRGFGGGLLILGPVSQRRQWIPRQRWGGVGSQRRARALTGCSTVERRWLPDVLTTKATSSSSAPSRPVSDLSGCLAIERPSWNRRLD